MTVVEKGLITSCCTRKNYSLRSRFSGEQGVIANKGSMMRNKILFVFILILSTSAWAKDSFLLEVSVSQSKQNGEKWDAYGGPPDIFVVVDDVELFKCKNRYGCEVVFRSEKQSESFLVKILDRDVKKHDLIGEGECRVNEACTLGNAEVKIWPYRPQHNLGSCDEEIALAFFDREFITNLKKYSAVRDYGFTINECTQSTKTNIISIVSTNWFIGSNFLNYYTSESKLVVNTDGSDPRYLVLKPDTVLNTTDWLVSIKKALSNNSVMINSTRVKK